jgi:hypothetical protein
MSTWVRVVRWIFARPGIVRWALIPLLLVSFASCQGDIPQLLQNPLSTEAIQEQIPALQARGVAVTW